MSVERNTGNLPPAVSELALDDAGRISLCEVLDRVLNKGVVVAGEATISVADIDLIYLGLRILLSSIETARSPVRHRHESDASSSTSTSTPTS